MKCIVSCAPEMEAVCREELRRAGLRANSGALLPGVLVVETTLDYAGFAEKLRPTVFPRHHFPVSAEARLTGNSLDDLDELLEAAEPLGGSLAAGDRFAIQARLVREGDLLRKFDVNSFLSGKLSGRSGAVLDTRQPVWVVSVLVKLRSAYLGLSLGRLNRSLWPGGARRFKREEEQISRSEFKLLEAIEVFGLKFPANGEALDLGAAPGGWTRILRKQGLRVTAVDPSDLDPRLTGDPSIRHARVRIQDFEGRQEQFAVIVNDLKMDARASASCMLRAAPWLRPGGIGLMTLKLPLSVREPKALLSMIEVVLGQLRRKYEILGIRHLFHNRNEVTVGLRRLS